MAEEPFCLPLIFPYIVELRRSGDAPDKMLEIFHLLVRYFGGRQEAKAGKDAEVGEKEIGEGTSKSWHEILWERVLYNLCIS